MDGAVWDHYLKFKGQKHPEATNEFNEMLQDQLLYEEYYKWAQHSKMDNEVDFIRAVDNYKSNPTWDEAANIVQVYLTPGKGKYVNVDDSKLEEWIRSCCRAKKMLPRKS
jgi:hypothetical protein